MKLWYVRQIKDTVHFEMYLQMNMIHVFSNGDEYLHSFGCDLSGVNMLSVPWGIYVASQYVYVTNWGNHTISVYTTEGKHVISLGKRGSNEGYFSNPRGVCVDQYGFVYVCE